MDYKLLLFLEPSKDCLSGMVPVLSFQVPGRHNCIFYSYLQVSLRQASGACQSPFLLSPQTFSCLFCPAMTAWDMLPCSPHSPATKSCCPSPPAPLTLSNWAQQVLVQVSRSPSRLKAAL